MRSLVILVLGGCVHAAVATPRTPEAISGDTHALLAAYDRGDATGFAAATAPTFVHFEGHVHDRASELAEMKPHPPYVARTWKDEHVFVRPTDATFIGLATEREIGNDSHGNREWSGWCTVSWVRDGDTWKAVYWGWQPYRSTIERLRDF